MTAVIREKPRRTVGSILLKWILPCTALLSLLAGILASIFPTITETIHARGVYKLLISFIGGITSLVPVSVVEIVIMAMLITIPVIIVVNIMHSRRKRRWGDYDCGMFPVKKAAKIIAVIFQIFCAFFTIYMLMCGLNYHRMTFSELSGLPVRDSSTEELTALCGELVNRANELRADTLEDEAGVMRLSANIWENAILARDAFGSLSDDYDFLPDYGIRPKPLINSWAMSFLQLTGVYSPYSGEANINTCAPDYNILSTMCHELAHTRGFMREDEANFIGYLACEKSDSADMQYSGVALALVHSLNRLYTADYESFLLVNDLCSDGVKRDFAYNNAYWEKHNGPVADVSDAINNAYLKANNQSDGVQSYGRMVDLLLADYRVRHSSEEA